MKDLYKLDEDCMDFSDETLERHFFDIIKNIPGVELEYSYCDEQPEAFYNIMKDNSKYFNKIHKIDSVSFDGEKGDFDIHFFNSAMVSIFLFDEPFMFIDDLAKRDVRGIEPCIIYEGYLRDKTHKQILDIFLELFKILYGATKIEYEEHLVSKIGYYNKNNYTVKLKKPNCEKQAIQFENILFLIN